MGWCVGPVETAKLLVVGLQLKFSCASRMASEKKQVANKEEPLEKQLWKAADKLRKNIDAAEYKHVVLGLFFLIALKGVENSSSYRGD